jgi:uncharacterized protein involved in exopolysaccharide biosynthesis
MTAVRLPDLLELLHQGKWYVAAALLAAMVMGGAYLHSAPPIYNVMAELLVVQRAQLSNDARPIRSDPRFLTTQAKIIESSTVAEAALASLPISPGGDAAAGVNFVVRSLTATPIKETNVMTLAYRTSNPEEGARILENVIDAYRDYVRGLEEAYHEQDIKVLMRMEQEQRERLAALHRRYQDAYATSGARAGAGSQQNAQKGMLPPLTGGSWLDLREELWRAESQAAALRGSYGAKHPKVVAMNKKIAELHNQLAMGIDQAYQAELEQGRALSAQRLEQKQLRAEIQLRSEIESLRLIHQSTLEKLRDAELTGQGLDRGRANVAIHVLQAPTPPKEKMWPIPVLVLTPCVAIGLVAGLGLSWITHPDFRSRRRGETSGAAESSMLATDAVAGSPVQTEAGETASFQHRST